MHGWYASYWNAILLGLLVCIFIFKTTWKSYFKNNEKNTWKFTKNPGKIMEISWNFVSPKKWEPCIFSMLCLSACLFLIEVGNLDYKSIRKLYVQN